MNKGYFVIPVSGIRFATVPSIPLCHFYIQTNPQPGDIPLKVIVMSASIDFERFCEYFDGCPRMDCPGKQLFSIENGLLQVHGVSTMPFFMQAKYMM